MGRKRRGVMPVSISMDRKLSDLIDRYLEKNNGTRSHVVNMALSAYEPLAAFDEYRDYWECDMPKCRKQNLPKAEKCVYCGAIALWVIQREHQRLLPLDTTMKSLL